MADMRAKVVVDLSGNLKQQARAYGDALGRFSRSGQRHLTVLSNASRAAMRPLDRAGNRMTALVTGVAGTAAVRQIGTYQDRLRMLARNADVTHDRIATLSDGIDRVAASANVRVPRGELLGAIEAIVRSTGDLKFAEDNLENIGLALSATRAQGGDVGLLAVQLRKLGVTLDKDVLRSMAILVKQGKEGSFEFRDMAQVAAEAFSAMAGMGGTGERAVREVGALLQVAQKVTESAPESVTAVRALLQELIDKSEDLRAEGIEIFDAEKLKEGEKALRPLSEILKEIISQAKGDPEVLKNIFTNIRGQKPIMELMRQFNETGGFEGYEQLINVTADSEVIIKDATDAAEDFAAAWADITNAWERFGNTNLAPIIKDVADAIREIDPDQFDSLLNSLGIAAATVGGLVVASKTIRTAAAARSLFARGGAGRGAGALAGGAVGAAPMPVAVVNWPAGMMGGGGAGGGRGATVLGPDGKPMQRPARGGRAPAVTSRAGRAAGMLRGAGRFAGRALPWLGVGLAGIDAASALFDDELTRQQKGARFGAAGGGLAGMAAGAALGGMILPGIGAIPGGIIGYLLGEYLGGEVGRNVAAHTGRSGADPYAFEDRRAAMSNGRVQVEISVDQDGRVTGVRSRSRGDVETINDAGGMFGGGVGF